MGFFWHYVGLKTLIISSGWKQYVDTHTYTNADVKDCEENIIKMKSET